MKGNSLEINEITEKIIGCALRVHKILGPGFLESVYQAALDYEFNQGGIKYEKEKDLPVQYGDVRLDVGFRCDFIVENEIIVECKAVRELTSIDEAQVINYLKITKLEIGLLINFNVIKLKDGIKRLANNYTGNKKM